MSQVDKMSPYPEENSSYKEESLAQKAGFIAEEEFLEEVGEQFEPVSVATNQNAWSRFGFKAFICAVAVLSVVSVIALMWQGAAKTLDSRERETPNVSKQAKLPEKDEEDIGELKTSSAIGSQKAELAQLNSKLSAESKPEPTSSPSPQVTSSPVITAKPQKQEPKVVTVSRPSTPLPRSIPKSAPVIASTPTAPPRPQPIKVTPPPKVEVRKQPPPPPSPVIQPKADIKEVKKKPQTEFRTVGVKNTNPSEAWQAAAKLGMYTASNRKKSNQTSLAGNGRDNTVSKNQGDSTGQKLVVGTAIPGRLQTSLSWTGKSSYNKSYTIKLTEALKNSDGSVAIPKNALVVARIESVASEGWLDMRATSVVFSVNSKVVEKVIPKDAILIQAEGGSPLRAEYKNLAYSNSLPDRKSRLLALKKKLQKGSRQSNIKNNTPYFRILTLEKDSKVQIYINRSFSL